MENSMNMDSDAFDVDEHYKFLEEIDEFLEEQDQIQCEICKRFVASQYIWSCVDTDIERCEDCQAEHEGITCQNCQLAYKDF